MKRGKTLVISSRVSVQLLIAVMLDLNKFGHKPIGRSSTFNTLLEAFVKMRNIEIPSETEAWETLDRLYPPRDTSKVEGNRSFVARNVNEWQKEEMEKVEESLSEVENEDCAEKEDYKKTLENQLEEVRKLIKDAKNDMIKAVLVEQEKDIMFEIKKRENKNG